MNANANRPSNSSPRHGRILGPLLVVGLAVGLSMQACGGDDDTTGAGGTGGAGGSGGSAGSAKGGTAGTGGASGSAGSGTAGKGGSGGSAGATGGTAGAGGSGKGGGAGTGGAGGKGGTAGTGGAAGTGGTAGAAGSAGTAGTAGAAGAGGSDGGMPDGAGGTAGSDGGDGGPTTDVSREGGSDAPADSGADRTDTGSMADAADAGFCGNYCSLMASTCATVTNYPFTAPGSCATACAGFTTAQQACYTYFVNLAKDGPDGSHNHNCEHAWGEDDTECP
jgi:hypothetical protein